MLIRHSPFVAGIAAAATLAALLLASPRSWREGLRETSFDAVLAADQLFRPVLRNVPGPRVVVVDIDDRSLEALGAWPWPREITAHLIEAIAAAKPAVIAVDILFAEPDSRSPAALARRLAALTHHPELAALADQLPDGDQALARAAGAAPLVLGFVLDPVGTDRLSAPVAVRGTPVLDGLWTAAGAVGPVAALRERASGVGTVSLPADADGIVRQAPVLVSAAGAILPGLALEAVRLARGESSYLVEASPPMVATADLKIPLGDDGLLRLLPVSSRAHAARAVSAIDVVQGEDIAARLAGAIVLVGGSAPELGGLRATAFDPLTPSVEIQADAIEQMLAGRFPRAVVDAGAAPTLLLLALGAAAALFAARLTPLAGAFVLVVAVLLAWAAAIGTSLAADRLLDPLLPSVAAATVFVVASVASFAVTYRNEVLVRRRFEQRLAPAIVRRIVENPGLVKVSGERREITSLFTDLEGSTAMTRSTDPGELVALLDAYFEKLAAIVVEHGGMVDKIVGDGLHALFNAPLDLENHARRAVACAVAIAAWTEQYRAAPAPAALGFGRTRIGIETGEAVVGDVGIQRHLNYSAYGDAVNASARFEAANKELGSAICVGPAAAARCDPASLRPLGAITVRGRDDSLAVYEPWPPDASPAWRERYLAAFAMIGRDPCAAAASFEALAAERAADPVPRRLAERLRERPDSQ
jgi:adenylate cyclase